MLESLLFMFLIFIGGIFLIASLVILLFGIIKKSSKTRKFAFVVGIVPFICFGLIAFWYGIAIPSFNKNEMKEFSGTYKIEELEKDSCNLKLLENGTYEFFGKTTLRLRKNGTWKTGGIDGQFEFYDNNDNLIEFASPFGGDGTLKIIFNLYESDEVRFEKIEK